MEKVCLEVLILLFVENILAETHIFSAAVNGLAN